eukprot:356258-Chlamydomonas_euryale.AAC.11
MHFMRCRARLELPHADSDADSDPDSDGSHACRACCSPFARWHAVAAVAVLLVLLLGWPIVSVRVSARPHARVALLTHRAFFFQRGQGHGGKNVPGHAMGTACCSAINPVHRTA